MTLNAEHADQPETPQRLAGPAGSAFDARKPRAAISWSGGKDSCAAFARALGSFEIVAMVTMFDEAAVRSRSHGLRPEVLAAQADRLGIRPVTACCTWQTYDD